MCYATNVEAGRLDFVLKEVRCDGERVYHFVVLCNGSGPRHDRERQTRKTTLQVLRKCPSVGARFTTLNAPRCGVLRWLSQFERTCLSCQAATRNCALSAPTELARAC